MPFGGWFDTYYEDVFCPAIEDGGLKPRRADDIYRTGTIMHDIWNLTKEAKIVLADLTGKNPNVFYELGLAHALAKPVILVTESLEDIPFDLRALRIVEYNKDSPHWGNILREKISKSIKEVLASPKKAILPAFLEVDERSENEKVSPHELEILEIRREVDLLRREMFGRKPVIDLKTLSRGEAEKLFSRLVEMDASYEEIEEFFNDYNVPQGWVEREYRKFSNDSAQLELPT